MIQVYSENNKNFSSNGNMTLLPEDAYVSVELNGSWNLTMQHPIDQKGRWKYLEEGAVIKAPSFNGEQLFRIYKKEKTEDGISVEAYPIFFDSKNDCFLTDVRPTVKNGQEALNIMLAPNKKYSAQSDIVRKATAYYEYMNLMEAINGDNANSFLNRWGGEILYDNFKIIVNERVGGDYGVELRYGKNIPANGITETVDMSEVVTRIYPKSYNGYKLSGNGYVDSPILSNYPTVKAATMKFDNIKMREDAQEDDEEKGVVICDTKADLDRALTEACKRQFESGLDKPKVTIEADMVLLQNTDQYKDYEILETVSLGDTIHCLHNKLGIETDARVIGLEYDCLTERVTSVVLGDFKQNYLDKVAGTVDKIESVITPDGGLMADKVEGFLNAIKTQIRYQKNVAKKQDVRAILFEDLDPESPLYGALCLGTLGLQISKRRTADGRDWDWTTAFNANGGYANTIVAGKLADKAGSNWWNLDTGEMQISARATVDGKPLEDQLAQNKSYMWIAYADDEQGNGISLEPEGKKYIGFAENQISEKVDLSDPSKFKWSQIDGGQGANGIATVVLHLYKRSDSEPQRLTKTLTYHFETDTLSGTIDNGWTRDIPEGDSPLYIISATASGRTETVEIEGTRWSQPVILAKDGESGVPGEPGKDGKTSYFHVKYSKNENGYPMTETPSTYIGTYVDFEELDSSDYKRYTWHRFEGVRGENGIPGTDGLDGKTSYLHIAYANSSDGSIDFSVSDSVGKSYMGQYTDFTEQDSTDHRKYTWSKIKGDPGERGLQGLQGEKGEQGIPGANGADGKTSYFHIKYSSVPNPTSSSQMTETPSAYIGTYVDYNPTDSTNPYSYTWARFQGEPGERGIPGTNGINGKTSYLHIAYANSADGSVDFSVSNSENKKYIGQYTDFQEYDSTDYRSYTWSKIKGEDGADGIDGLNVATVYLYKRAASKPSVPSSNVTYRFSDGYVSGLSNGWDSKIPSGTTPLYMILATASSKGSTDTISPSEWTAPEIFSQNGEDGKMLYGTCSTAGATARKDCTIEGFKLRSGMCVSIKFTYGNTAANPMLNINNTGAAYIYAYGSKLAAGSTYNWGSNATVVFVYDGANWNIADGGALEKAEDAAKTATDFMKFDKNGLQIGNNQTGTFAGYMTRITGNSLEILDESEKVVAAFQVDAIDLGKDSINTIIRFCGAKGNLWYNAAEDFFQLESKRLRNRATELASLYAINGKVRSGYNAYTDRLEMYAYNAQNVGSQAFLNSQNAEFYLKGKMIISAPGGLDYNPGVSKVLYEGCAWMDNTSNVINFPRPITSLMTGIVLVFSLNENGSPTEWAYSSHFIPKYLLQDLGERTYSFVLSAETFNLVGVKFLHISNTRIVGHGSNNGHGTKNGITYDNRRWALRRVYGV